MPAITVAHSGRRSSQPRPSFSESDALHVSQSMLPFDEIPFETHPGDEPGYEVFKSAVWYSKELCNGCFAQVRNIGPVKERWMGASYMTLHEWYERTDNGSQEYTPFDTNRRYGTCFCLNCGADCTGDHRNTPLEDMIPLAERIFKYTKRRSPFDIDGKRFGREVRELMALRDSTGYETEVLGVAFGRALDRNQASQDSSATHSATAD